MEINRAQPTNGGHMQRQFKVTNTTVKPQRVVNGRDERTAIEKVGHPVSFSDEKGKPIMLQQGQVTVVNELDSGLLNLKRGGFVRIEEIKDFADVLSEHTYKPTTHQVNAEIRKGKVVPSGTKGIEEDAVNPDGEPNFVAKASTTKRAVKNAKSRSNQKSKQG